MNLLYCSQPMTSRTWTRFWELRLEVSISPTTRCTSRLPTVEENWYGYSNFDNDIASFPGFPLAFISPAVEDFSTAGEIKTRGKPGNEANDDIHVVLCIAGNFHQFRH